MASVLTLSEKKVSTTQQGWLRGFRCRGCGECCHLRIPVTVEDVRRIVRATGRSARQLVEFAPVAEFRGENDHLEWVWFGPRRQHRRVMCLREVDGHCLFLDADNRCKGYRYRPTVCRIHPFVLETCDRGKSVEGVELNDGCECGGSFDGSNTVERILETHLASEHEDSQYRSLVARWNRSRRQRSEEEFLCYLGLAD
jgi:Fe-S-cluster containining protein